jgi:flavin-dependent dehydrogenase
MTAPDTTDVLVLGSSIAAWMTAAHLARKEGLSVTVVGPSIDEERRPIVGESTVEPAVLFFRDLGLQAIDEQHAVKYGLTFHHKLNPDDPSCPIYSVHAPERRLAHDSRQLHRPRFDGQLREHALASGVTHVLGRAASYRRVRGVHRHEVVLRGEGAPTLRARWIVDATGRSRFLGKQLTTYTKASEQRCAFWLRLADFEPFLSDPGFDDRVRRPLDYDPWWSTHHFMSPGFWIWGIPLRTEHEGQRQISVGITWHPDHLDREVRTLDDALALCDAHHPVVSRMIRSGRVLDQHLYRNYLYAADQLYDADGWFLVGDAARTVDPLYSTGLSMTAIQVQQVASLIRTERDGTGAVDDADVLQRVWAMVADRRQRDIAHQYATMGDPWTAHLRRYWNLNQWFNGVLPLWCNGWLTDPRGARWLLSRSRDDRDDHDAFFALLGASRRDDLALEHLDASFDFDRLLHRAFDERGALRQFSRAFRLRALLRLRMLALARGADAPRQLRVAGSELARSTLLSLAARRQGALEAQLVRPLDAPLGPNDTETWWTDLSLLRSPADLRPSRLSAAGVA